MTATAAIFRGCAKKLSLRSNRYAFPVGLPSNDNIKDYPCVPSCVVFIKFPQEVSKRHHIFCSVGDALPNGNVEDESLEFAIVSCNCEECLGVTSQDDLVIAR